MYARIDAAAALLSNYDTEFIVAHVGSSAVILRPYEAHADDVVITTGEAGLMPGGLHVSPGMFWAWSSLEAGSLLTIRTDARAMAMFDRIDLVLPQVCVDREAVRLATCLFYDSRAGRDEFDWRERAVRIAQDAIAHAYERLEASVSSLVGRGPGSTPTGDDVLIGVCAALSCTGHSKESTMIAALASNLSHRTTRSSRLFLRAAQDGRFAERVHEMTSAFSSLSLTANVMKDAERWGATSGLDLAAGMLGGFATVRSRARQSSAGRTA
ncbi:MAG: DUF2877 domain-containing protein [Candidatus Nanopelagicales bacterium]